MMHDVLIRRRYPKKYFVHHPFPPQFFGPHPFPVIDFKFRNSGNATSLLTAYRIEILHSRIDPTPWLTFDWDIPGGHVDTIPDLDLPFYEPKSGDRLNISARNMGWGAATNFTLSLEDDDILASIFGRRPATTPTIEDDRGVLVHTMFADMANTETFRKLAADFATFYQRQIDDIDDPKKDTAGEMRIRVALNRRNKDIGLFENYFEIPNLIRELVEHNEPFVTITAIKFEWKCSEIRNFRCDAEISLSPDRFKELLGSHLLLLQDKFVYIPGVRPLGGPVPPGPTFCAMIEPEKGRHTKKYVLSRHIEAGGVERFQILIGATKSCILELQLVFVVDGKTEVRSRHFKLVIENRRDHKFHDEYRDGQEIAASITEEQEATAKAWPWSGWPCSED
jgi:hypothetical protein